MTNEELKRDAARYWRLRVLGCAPCDSKQLENGTVLRFSNLDEFIDHDIKIRPSRGEAEIYENKTEGAAVSASPQPRCPKCGNNQLRIDFNVTDGGKNRRHYVVCKTGEDCGYRAWVDDLSQFFAAAPAQEPRLMITRSGEIHKWCPDCRGDCCSPYKARQEQPVENSPILQWLTDRVHDERGAIEFGMTEHGNLGLFRSGEERPWATGDDVEEVLCRASQKYPSGKDYEPSPQKGKPWATTNYFRAFHRGSVIHAALDMRNTRMDALFAGSVESDRRLSAHLKYRGQEGGSDE